MQKRQRRVVITPRPASLEYNLIARINLSKIRDGVGGTVVCKEKGATEANVGSTHVMSRAEGPEPTPAPVAALALLCMQAPSLRTLIRLWFHMHFFFFFLPEGKYWLEDAHVLSLWHVYILF